LSSFGEDAGLEGLNMLINPVRDVLAVCMLGQRWLLSHVIQTEVSLNEGLVELESMAIEHKQRLFKFIL
jgi:hypothetical protein